jgi:hypothetical protein
MHSLFFGLLSARLRPDSSWTGQTAPRRDSPCSARNCPFLACTVMEQNDTTGRKNALESAPAKGRVWPWPVFMRLSRFSQYSCGFQGQGAHGSPLRPGSHESNPRQEPNRGRFWNRVLETCARSRIQRIYAPLIRLESFPGAASNGTRYRNGLQKAAFQARRRIALQERRQGFCHSVPSWCTTPKGALTKGRIAACLF